MPSPSRRSRCNRSAAIRLYLLAIGRLRRGPLYDLQALYAGRIVPPVTLIELEEKRRLPAAELKQREAELILSAVPPGARLVALDERGAAWTTKKLATQLTRWRADATDMAFVIGSADGLDPALKRDAAVVLALSSMTLPHGLVRVMLAEQLYRAVSINAGHPYHRG